jgi:hypothetical protein
MLEVKTFTFKHIGGTAPEIYQILAAMFINKNWTRLMNDHVNKKEIKYVFLLFTENVLSCSKRRKLASCHYQKARIS